MIAAAPLAPIWPMLWRQTKCGLLALWRVPAFTISGLALPVMFFAFFGLGNSRVELAGINAGAYFLASYGAYAMGSMMVFNFGVGVATERGSRVDVLYRATPLPPLVYMGAKLIVAVLFGLLSLALLFTFGAVVGGVRMEAAVWVGLVLRLLAGSLPFIALGFAIGYGAGPGAAPGVANLIYLPLAFGSGLFMPLPLLPKVVQQAAPYLPTYHYAQLAWGAVGAQVTEPPLTSLLWLAAFTAIFLALASRFYFAEERRRFA
jgi:ABC-2 type transport system permease protein